VNFLTDKSQRDPVSDQTNLKALLCRVTRALSPRPIQRTAAVLSTARGIDTALDPNARSPIFDSLRGRSMLDLKRCTRMIVALSAAAAAGCAQIPSHELSQYRNAFAQVQQASEDILIDFAEAKENAEKRAAEKSAAPASGPAALFSVQLEGKGGEQPSAVEVRRTALRTIDKFNNVLVTLAEGKSIDAVKGTADGFVQAAGRFVTTAAGAGIPGLSTISSLVQTLAGELEKARLREEFSSAVRRGAPVIDRMLAAMVAEREDHLALRRDEALLRQVDIVDEITANAALVRDLVAASGAPPAAEDPREDLQSELNDALQPAAKGLEFTLPLELAYTKGKPAFGVAQAATARQSIARIAERATAFQANLAQYESLRSALNNYGAMLERTRGALRLLVDALDRPQKFEEVSEELFQIAFSVKRDVEAFRAARRGAQ
jgi:hypothetical protein